MTSKERGVKWVLLAVVLGVIFPLSAWAENSGSNQERPKEVSPKVTSSADGWESTPLDTTQADKQIKERLNKRIDKVIAKATATARVKHKPTPASTIRVRRDFEQSKEPGIQNWKLPKQDGERADSALTIEKVIVGLAPILGVLFVFWGFFIAVKSGKKEAKEKREALGDGPMAPDTEPQEELDLNEGDLVPVFGLIESDAIRDLAVITDIQYTLEEEGISSTHESDDRGVSPANQFYGGNASSTHVLFVESKDFTTAIKVLRKMNPKVGEIVSER